MTNDLTTLLADLAHVPGGDRFAAATWQTSTAPIPDAAAWLGELAGASGWLMLTESIFVLHAGRWRCVSGRDPGGEPTERDLAARVLEGEFALGSDQSVHVRRAGAELREYRVEESTSGTSVLVQSRSQVSTERSPGLGRLRYRVAWRAETEGDPGIAVLRPWVARFCGWED